MKNILSIILLVYLFVMPQMAFASSLCSVVASDKEPAQKNAEEVIFQISDFIPPHLHQSRPIGLGTTQLSQYQQTQANIGNKHVAKFAQQLKDSKGNAHKIILLKELFSDIHTDLTSLSPASKQIKMNKKIKTEDPNIDPFGDLSAEISSFKPNQPQLSLVQRRIIKHIINKRFKATENGDLTGELFSGGDLLVNQVNLPNNQTVPGYQLIRGDLAQHIFNHKEKKEQTKAANDPSYQPTPYAYPKKAEKVMTRSGERDAAKKIFNAGFERLQQALSLTNISVEAKSYLFAETTYFLYQGLQLNRGGDGSTRTFLTTVSYLIFGKAIKIPQDIDLKAYVLNQQEFINRLVDEINLQI